jgi:hypothetical protein
VGSGDVGEGLISSGLEHALVWAPGSFLGSPKGPRTFLREAPLWSLLRGRRHPHPNSSSWDFGQPQEELAPPNKRRWILAHLQGSPSEPHQPWGSSRTYSWTLLWAPPPSSQTL